MAVVIPLIGEIVSIVLDILAMSQIIRSNQAGQADQKTLLATELLASVSKNLLVSPTDGLHSLKAVVDDTNADLAVDVANLTDLINLLTPATLPPDVPPDWPGQITSDWLGTLANEPWWGAYEQTRTLGQKLYDVETQLLGMTGADGWPDRHGPWFALVDYAPDMAWELVKPWRGGGPSLPPTNVDWSAWDGEMTLVQFLTALYPEIGWDHVGPGSYGTPGIVWGHITGYGSARWRCLVPEWQLPWVSGRAWTALAKLTDGLPPLWPGLDKVSLGTPVQLTASGIITGDMDGILMDVTAEKPGAGGFGADGSHYTWRGGWLAFLDATGRAEEYQFMGWSSSFYVPKHMAHANGVCLVLRDISTCTVTPFTID